MRRQFVEARKKRRTDEATAEPGTQANAGAVPVPDGVPDNVLWEHEGRTYVRISGFRTVMVFEVGLKNEVFLSN